MADWTDIPTNNLLPGEPWTSAKALAAFENPKAIAEGAADAPRVQADALGGLYLGHVSGSGWSGMSGLGGVKEIVLVGHSRTLNNHQIRFSNDNGSSWGSGQIFLASTNETFVHNMKIDLETGECSFTYNGDAGNGASSTTLTMPSGETNAFQLRVSGTNSYFGFLVIQTGGITP